MATTGFWPVKSRLKDVIEYARNPDKTIERKYLDDDLYVTLEYAADPAKTDETMYVSGVNCSKTRAYEEMCAVKKRFGERGTVIAYHGYQSFAAGEVTPEEAHQIGIETARRMWGDRYQVVITTHLNTSKLHNHFVVNATSFVDGKKYRNKIGDHMELRKVSDAICREHQKSVLENVPFYGGGKKRYWVEKNGQLTHRDMLKRDIDEAIAHCYKESMFINYLESLGYEFVRSYNDYEHPSVKAPSWQRPIRIDKLGAEYTREAIAERLRSNLGKDNLVLSDFQPPDRRRKPLLIILQSYPRYKEPDGFTVFFQVIVDFFKWIAGIPQNDVRHYAPLSPEFRAIWKDLDKISEQTHFLCKHSIVDSNDFHRYEQQIDDIIVDLVEERQKLRNRIRRVKDPDEETALKEKCKEITKQIEPYRKEKRICEQIKKRQPELQKAVEQELQAELGVQPKNRQKQYERNSER